jgi:hypothetical protein
MRNCKTTHSLTHSLRSEQGLNYRMGMKECTNYYISLFSKSKDLEGFSRVTTGLRYEIRKKYLWFLMEEYQFSLQEFFKCIQSTPQSEKYLFQLFIYSNDNFLHSKVQDSLVKDSMFLIQNLKLKEPLSLVNVKDVEKYVLNHFSMDFHLTKQKSTEEILSELLN